MVEERRSAPGSLFRLMFAYFFLITFSIYLIKPAKDSLFLTHLGRENLPLAFILTAILMGVAVSLNSRLIQRMNRPLYLSLSLAVFIVGSLIFWQLIRQPSPWKWTFLLLYSWGDILLVTTITQFWILVNDLFAPREAKKHIGFFVSGGLLGGVGGSLVGLFRPAELQTEDLILLCSFLLLFCVLIIFVVQKQCLPEKKDEEYLRPEARQAKVGLGQSLALLKKNRYVLLISGMMVTAIVVSNLVDFQFKFVAQTSFPDKNERTSFFATFYLAVLIISYFFTVLATSRILKNLGLRGALLILPLILLIGSLAVFVVPQVGLIIWAVCIKGVDKSLYHSLTQSVRELLYIPIPQDIKYRAKVFIDMFLNKFADGLTGLLLIFVAPFLTLSPKVVSPLAVIVIVIWMVLNFRVTREYVNIVKKNLQLKWRDADRLIADKIDVDMTKLVFDTLQSRERSSVLYAMNMFDLIKKEKLSPELRRLISYKADEVRARSMDALLDVEGEALLPEFDDALEPEDLDAQVKEIMSLDVYQGLMKEHIAKTALTPGKHAEVAKMEAAKIMGMMDAQTPLTKELRRLLKDESPEVVRYAAESAGRLKKREFVPLLLAHLSKSTTQEAASRALSAYGGAILGTLKDYLSDSEENIRARRSIPEILARTGLQRAGDILTLELAKENGDTEAEIIEALHKMRSNHPRLRFSETVVLSKTVSLIKKCYLMLIQIHELKSDRKKEVLAKDLENTLSRTMKQVFELLGLIYPQEDIIKAYQNILTGTKKALDYSVELMDNILKKEVKELLIPLIEDTSFEEKVRMSRKMLRVAEKIDIS